MTNWAGTAADLQKLYESLNERHSRLYADHEALAARLAEAERFIAEIRAESAEDYRLPSYVVVQMSTATWDKLRASDSASATPTNLTPGPCRHLPENLRPINDELREFMCAVCGSVVVTVTVSEGEQPDGASGSRDE